MGQICIDVSTGKGTGSKSWHLVDLTHTRRLPRSLTLPNRIWLPWKKGLGVHFESSEICRQKRPMGHELLHWERQGSLKRALIGDEIETKDARMLST